MTTSSPLGELAWLLTRASLPTASCSPRRRTPQKHRLSPEKRTREKRRAEKAEELAKSQGVGVVVISQKQHAPNEMIQHLPPPSLPSRAKTLPSLSRLWHAFKLTFRLVTAWPASRPKGARNERRGRNGPPPGRKRAAATVDGPRRPRRCRKATRKRTRARGPDTPRALGLRLCRFGTSMAGWLVVCSVLFFSFLLFFFFFFFLFSFSLSSSSFFL